MKVAAILLVAAVAAVGVGAGNMCKGTGWVTSPMGLCYKFFTDIKMNWATAQSLCQDMKGSLAILDSLDAIYWMGGIQSYEPKLRVNSMWIAGHKKKKDGKFYWVKDNGTMTQFTVTDWAPRQPDNAGGNENCVHVLNNKGPAERWYQWNDLRCDIGLGFICQRDPGAK